MKRLVYGLLLFSITLPAYAHPGIGIVKDRWGNIYYTDLTHVWKISPTGEKTIAVQNVHTHELYMDSEDNLFGEHLWYNGESVDTWGHYVWCLKNDGQLIKIKEPSEGFLSDYSFVRDSAGNMYWVERFTETKFMRKRKDGTIENIGSGKFSFVSWLHSTRDGTIYFTEGGRLQRLKDGKFKILSKNLDSKTTNFTTHGRNYDGYGIWTDREDNVYIAMLGSKKIQRITKDGGLTTIYYSNNTWIPCGGVFDDKNNLWVLEYSITNEARVKKIPALSPSKSGSAPFSVSIHTMITIAVALSVIGLAFLARSILKRKKEWLPRKRMLI